MTLLRDAFSYSNVKQPALSSPLPLRERSDRTSSAIRVRGIVVTRDCSPLTPTLPAQAKLVATPHPPSLFELRRTRVEKGSALPPRRKSRLNPSSSPTSS